MYKLNLRNIQVDDFFRKLFGQESSRRTISEGSKGGEQ
jgi:hypothetical protein